MDEKSISISISINSSIDVLNGFFALIYRTSTALSTD
jgi:hypothetical protein